VNPETIDVISQVTRKFREELIALPTIIIGKVTIQFKLKLWTSDHSALSKVFGHKVGGIFRCNLCNANFNNLRDLWSYKYISAHCKIISLKELLELWTSGKGGTEGHERIPPILGDSLDDLKKIDVSASEWSWIKDFIIGIDALHNCKGFLKSITTQIMKLDQFNKIQFLDLLNKKIQRKDVSDLDGGHYRLLYARYNEIFIEPMTNMNLQEKHLLLSMLKVWREIQWILYTPPANRENRALQLRFFVLVFLLLDRCHKLFPDIEPPPQTRCHYLETEPETESPANDLTSANIKDWITILVGRLKLDIASQSFRTQYHLTGPYGRILKPELWKLFKNLRKDAKSKGVLGTSLTPATSSIRTFIKTVMSVYLHTLVAHAPIVFQTVDFRSTNTERPEAKLAWIKNVLNNTTDKNLKMPQALREVLLRHVADSMQFINGYKDMDPGQSQASISKSFKNYVFSELEVSLSEHKCDDVDALLQNLTTHGFAAGQDWKQENGKIIFTTQEACQSLHKCNMA
jgi:hypothetical protein